MKPILSICIPTYNRAKFLPDLFESILKQINKENEDLIEVAVSDNASEDNTLEVINRYKKHFKNFTYFRWDKNMGADRNYLKCVEISNGEFCWLMGSDDKIEEGSINYILDILSKNNDVSGITVNRIAYDFHLKKIFKERKILYGLLKSDTMLRNISDIVFYLGVDFSYISGQIINKRIWDEVIKENNNKLSEYFNAYVHIYIILNMIKKNPKWYYISRPCVGWRSGNDSFLSNGYINRVKLDIIGYEKIYGDVFGRGSKEYSFIMKRVCRIYNFWGLLGLKLNSKCSLEYFSLIRLWIKYYWRYPVFWYNTFIILITPNFIFKIARFLYRKTIKKFIR